MSDADDTHQVAMTTSYINICCDKTCEQLATSVSWGLRKIELNALDEDPSTQGSTSTQQQREQQRQQQQQQQQQPQQQPQQQQQDQQAP
jgi:transcription initiation factor TFIID subunit TAF12